MNHRFIDIVNIQREEWGGGEIWFDNEIIRKDGKFIPEDLCKLNRNIFWVGDLIFSK